VNLPYEGRTKIAFGISTDYAYDVLIEVTDTVGQTTPKQDLISPSSRLYEFKKNAAAVGRTASVANRFLLPPTWDLEYKGQTPDARFANIGHNHSGIYAPASHTHTPVEAGAAPASHTHTKANITDFAHTHTKANITDFAHTHATSDITNVIAVVRDSLYPVGTIYMSTSATNPGSIVGGTWERYAVGRVLVGVSEGESEFAGPGYTGGEKYHTLTVNEMPSHAHYESFDGATNTLTGGTFTNGKGIRYDSNRIWPTTSTVGANYGHNNMQPYIVCYMWKRTA
jgi:hypothetical protein